jgi:hypothetical protein
MYILFVLNYKNASVSKKCVRRTTAVREVQYSDLFFRLHGVRHTLNYTQYTLSISYLDTQNWNVLLIFTLKRFVSVTKNMYPLKRKGKNYRLISFRIFISLFADTDINTEKKLKHFSGDFPAVSVQFFSFFKMADTI